MRIPVRDAYVRSLPQRAVGKLSSSNFLGVKLKKVDKQLSNALTRDPVN